MIKRKFQQNCFLQPKIGKGLPGIKDVRMSITIELENSRRIRVEYAVQSDNFGQRIRNVQR
jgi:hypothetical protein